MIDVGSVLLGRYRLNARVGMGGMATVYDGEDLLLGRRVAVKIPLPSFAADPAFVTRFENEARAAAALTHPNIVAVYDVGEAEGTRFIVMEFVDGMTLKDLLARESPLFPEDMVQVGAQVGDALDAAHRRGLVHRDIKPGNILLTPEGRVKLADFGIALALGAESATRTGTLLGSVQYLAPEVARGEGATPYSDIYSLGVVLYEMGTGRLPYSGDTPVAIALQHVESDTPSPREWNPTLPPALEAIIMRAMAKAPGARFASAAEFAAALLAFSRGEPVPGIDVPATTGTTEAITAPYSQAGLGATEPIPTWGYDPTATQPMAAGQQASTAHWGWGQPAQGPAWGAAPLEHTQPLPAAQVPGAGPSSWSVVPVPAPAYPSARWPLVLLGLVSLLCVLGLVPLGMVAYRQVRPPTAPRATPGVGYAPALPQPASVLAMLSAGGGAVSLLAFGGRIPQLAADVYVAPGAWVIGDTTLGQGASVWFNAVLRGDSAPIVVGRLVNLQDGVVVHVDDGSPTHIGDEVTVGHAAIIHAATIGARVLIGMQSVILSGATVGEGSIIGAGALVPEGRTIPPRSLVLGTPGRVVREVRDEEYAAILESARHYAELAQAYRADAGRGSTAGQEYSGA